MNATCAAGRRGRRRAGHLLPLAAASLAAATAAGAAPEARADSAAPLVVQTAQGPIQGSIVDGMRRFAGVRYAAPPVGALRWRPPQPAPSHAGATVDATAFGSQCPQASGTGTDPEEGGNEDCLFLNVYTPPAAALRPLPVMLFVHGGGYTSGTGASYVPTPLVTGGNVIVVTINYRLGLLGALALASLDAEAPGLGSGTYGMQDQQAALRWVRDNAAAFGGDPGRVTLFGESAGAAYVCQDVASPTARGLFDRAISESGCGGTPATPLATGEAFGAQISAAAGCDGSADPLACLRALSPLAVDQDAIAASGNPAILTLASVPKQGGGVLPLDWFQAAAQGRIPLLPLMIGSNLHEGNLFVFTGLPAPTDQSEYLTDLAELVSYSTGVPPATIAAEYPVTQFPDYADALASAMTDGAFSCPTLLSRQLAVTRTLVYAYEFSDPDAPNLYGGPSIGPAHGSELTYLFDLGATLTPGQAALSQTMVDYWTSFAAIGRPGLPRDPYWRSFQLAGTQNLAPGAVGPLRFGQFATEHRCGFWEPYL